ncbi:hypothetical protein [Parasphingorhabdus sp.]|uniref:hypothetical protein n=1 Tax=Parasphingorhabdus sp. TaxID=2709688 RepID=UPI0035933CD8
MSLDDGGFEPTTKGEKWGCLVAIPFGILGIILTFMSLYQEGIPEEELIDEHLIFIVGLSSTVIICFTLRFIIIQIIDRER